MFSLLGSKNQDKKAVSGYITKFKDTNYKWQNNHHLGQNISVYQAELYAVINVKYELLRKGPLAKKYITIYNKANIKKPLESSDKNTINFGS